MFMDMDLIDSQGSDRSQIINDNGDDAEES